MRKNIYQLMQNWFTNPSTSAWQRLAASLLFDGKSREDVLKQAVACCLAEFHVTDEAIPTIASGLAITHDNDTTADAFRLQKIHTIQGVGALNAKASLDLSQKPLTVVYGENGSGKSSYVRLVKNVCNSKGHENIIGNVYAEEKVEPSAAIEIEKDGMTTPIQWISGDAPHALLRLIHIFDTPLAKIMIEENEIILEPQLLADLTVLSGIFDDVGKAVAEERRNCIPPEMPASFHATPAYRALQGITAQTDPASMKANFSWSDQKEAESVRLKRILAAENPQEKAQELRAGLGFLSAQKEALRKYGKSLSDDVVKRIACARQTLADKTAAAEVAATEFQSVTSVPGIGAEPWKTLWMAAKQYSERYLHPGIPHPNTQDGACCALCLQPLSVEARERFMTFESYVKSTAEREKNNALAALNALVAQLPSAECNKEAIKLSCEKYGFGAGEVDTLLSFYHRFLQRRSEIDKLLQVQSSPSETNAQQPVGDAPSEKEITEFFTGIETRLQTNIGQYEQAASDAKALQLKQSELEAEKWGNENPACIEMRCKQYRLDSAAGSANTTALSRLRAVVSELMITSEYTEQFQRELDALGATAIRIEMASRVSKGHTYHFIRLKGVKGTHKPERVLSEGEHRVISLASFLAEANLYTKKIPVIFDDPITSLDIEFEDRVAKRICELATSRQVIVFTHRLAFADLLKDIGKKFCKMISLMKDPLGIADVGLSLDKEAKTEDAIDIIINTRIPDLRKRKEKEDYSGYRDGCQALCSEIRKMVEKGIEKTLLHGTVMRFRKEISSQNIRYLNAITSADVDAFNRLMTKYSYDEHSQSTEKPRNLPPLDEIETDMKEFKTQLLSLSQRQKAFDKR